MNKFEEYLARLGYDLYSKQNNAIQEEIKNIIKKKVDNSFIMILHNTISERIVISVEDLVYLFKILTKESVFDIITELLEIDNFHNNRIYVIGELSDNRIERFIDLYFKFNKGKFYFINKEGLEPLESII